MITPGGLVDGRFFAHENARACQDLLRRAITRRGLPEVFYADNGAPFWNAWLARTCGVLGIRLVHSLPYSPEGRGKQERLNRYIREAFLAEAVHHGIESLDQLNDLFAAWAEQVGQPAGARRDRAAPDRPVRGWAGRRGRPARACLREAFRWSVTRRVTRTATVPLEGNSYAVDPALTGRRVELRYDPEDLTRIEVFLDGKPAGAATPFITRRHVHRAVPQAARPEATPTGIDYLGMVAAAHEEAAGTGAKIDFTQLGAGSPPATPASSTRGGARAAGGGAVSAAPWAAHFGLARTPFGKSIAARDLFARQAHAEAIARISFCVVESALGVVTGDVGAGKTVALRAAVSTLDPTRHQVIYIANPAFGTEGPVRHHRPGAGRPAALPQGRADGPGQRPARRRNRGKAPPGGPHLRRGPCHAAGPAGGAAAADQRRDGLGLPVRRDPGRAADLEPAAADGHLRRPRSADRHKVHDQADGPRRSPPPTCATTSSWPGARSRCSPMMPSPGCTGSPTGCPAPSTTPRPRPSSPPPHPGKVLIDDACAKKAVAELTRD